MIDFNNITALLIAVSSSTAFTSSVTYFFTRRKMKTDVKRAEVSIVTAKIDQADKIVTIATNLLDAVRTERNKLEEDKKELERLNKALAKSLEECEYELKNAVENVNKCIDIAHDESDTIYHI